MKYIIINQDKICQAKQKCLDDIFASIEIRITTASRTSTQKVVESKKKSFTVLNDINEIVIVSPKLKILKKYALNVFKYNKPESLLN